MTDRFRSGKLPGIFCVECKTHLSQERGEEKHNGGSYEDARDAETVKNQPFRNGCKADGKLNGRHGYTPCQFRLVRQGTGNPGGPTDGMNPKTNPLTMARTALSVLPCLRSSKTATRVSTSGMAYMVGLKCFPRTAPARNVPAQLTMPNISKVTEGRPKVNQAAENFDGERKHRPDRMLSNPQNRILHLRERFPLPIHAF